MIVVVALFGIPVLLRWMWLDHFRETKLPQPTGPFAVGRVTYAWKDPGHTYPANPASHTVEDYCRSLGNRPSNTSVARC
jgi:hypothetical protein